MTINIDRNFLDLGKGSWARREVHCDGVDVDLANYRGLAPGTTATERVRALQCLLREKGLYTGRLHGRYSPGTIAAARAWQERMGDTVRDRWTRLNWMTLLAAGRQPVLKFGSAGGDVRRVQRTLNAASCAPALVISGVFGRGTDRALRAYQDRVGIRVSGVVNPRTWAALAEGRR